MKNFLTKSVSHILLTLTMFSFLILVVALPLLLTVSQQQQIYTPHAATSSVPTFSHVFMIIEENHDYSQIIGSSAAPYITQLSNQYGLATNFFAITHPSLPNYIAVTTGGTQGITTDCTTCFLNVNNIASELDAAGKTWKAYQESMPSNCLAADAGNYAMRHNPFAYFTNLKTSCQKNDVPYTQFASDLASGNVGNFNFITPNLQDDMHNGTIQQGDNWLKTELPKIMASAAYQQNGLIIITFDEGQKGAGTTNQIPTILISPLGKQAFKSSVKYTLYSLLKTISDGLGVQPLGAAATEQDMSDFFGSSGGITNPPPTVTVPQPSTPPVTNPPQTGTSPIKHIFVITQENHDWSQIKGNQQMPYVNSLLSQYAHAENYVTPYHPSLPNYLALEGATNFGVSGSPLPAVTNINSTQHLTTLMKNAGVSWNYYMENLPGNGTTCNLTDPGTPFSEDHNAVVYFNDVSGKPPSSTNQYCIQHERPYTELATNLQNNTVAQYNFIAPSDYDTGEKLAPGSSCALCQGDTWLKSEIPKIQASQAYKDGGVIFLVWDEGVATAHNPSGMIVISQYAKKGYQNTISYSHASVVKTIEEIFGLSPFINLAANATDLSDFFTVPIAGSIGGSGTPQISQPTGGCSTQIPQGNTSIGTAIFLHGLGKAGDNANPNGGGNANPSHQQRTATISILDSNNQQVKQAQGCIAYNAADGFFNGTIDLGDLASGNYLVKVQVPGYLQQQVSGIKQITSGQTFGLQPIPNLTTGDINNDNQLDIIDYNLLIGCFGTKQNTASCTAGPNQQSPGTDLNDDGTVDGADYNLFLRELSVQKGG